MTDHWKRGRARRERREPTEEERRQETERRLEKLKQAWREHHPREDEKRPRRGKP